MNVFRKKTVWTSVTPIPSFVPRQLAIDMLHSHEEVIKTNPLVVDIKPAQAPRDAPADEFYATWYEIFQKIQVIPGIGKLGASDISFKVCFHDMPWGLQTHTYAPMGIDTRNKWQICGSQPGEPVVQQEMGIGAPTEGLYLREDVEVKCNVSMISFVKKEQKAASKVMVDRMVKKAELLDSGALQIMFEKGKLKTVNPADRQRMEAINAANSPMQPPLSPRMAYGTPSLLGNPHSPHPDAYNGQPQHPPQQYQQQQQHPPQQQQSIVMELPGDMYHAQQQGGFLQPNDNRASTISNRSSYSPNPNDRSWDQRGSVGSSRPTSYSSDGMQSPPAHQQQFTAELPTHTEAKEPHAQKVETGGANPYQPYNPQIHNDPNVAPLKWREVQQERQSYQQGQQNMR